MIDVKGINRFGLDCMMGRSDQGSQAKERNEGMCEAIQKCKAKSTGKRIKVWLWMVVQVAKGGPGIRSWV